MDWLFALLFKGSKKEKEPQPEKKGGHMIMSQKNGEGYNSVGVIDIGYDLRRCLVFMYEPKDIMALLDKPALRSNFLYSSSYEEEADYRKKGQTGVHDGFRGYMNVVECKAALCGDFPAGAEKLEAKIRRIRASSGHSLQSSVVGSNVNVGAYLAGRPDAMLRHKKTDKRVPCIRLVVVTDWHSGDSGSYVQKAMNKLAPYVVAVEMLGKQVEIWAANGTYYTEPGDYAGHLDLFKVKNFGERLNPGRTAFMCGTVDFYRKCGCFNVIIAEKQGGKVDGCLGRPIPFYEIEKSIRKSDIPMLQHAIALSARSCAEEDDVADYINSKLEEEFLDLQTVRIS